jgi:hypothetical protein
VHARFAAVRLASAGLMHSAQHAEAMRRQCFTADEVRARWSLCHTLVRSFSPQGFTRRSCTRSWCGQTKRRRWQPSAEAGSWCAHPSVQAAHARRLVLRPRLRAASFCQAVTAHLCCGPLPQDAQSNCCPKMSALALRLSRP